MDTRPEGLGVNGGGIKFRSLSLGGVRGKVRATLNENQISFESRNGHALDIRLNAIQRVHHHHTTLVPGWLAVVGLILVWVAWRGVAGKLQALLGSAGIVLSASHYATRRPTLTIDTKAEDCHTVFGSDIAMMRLCALIQRIQNGMSLEDAKLSVDNMVSDSEYPRSMNTDEMELIPEPVELFPSPVLSHFIDAMENDGEVDPEIEIVSPAIAIDDLDLPMWEEEPETPVIEQQMPAGLMDRSRANLFTQRNQVAQNGWQPPQQQHPYDQIHRTQPDNIPSYGMIPQHGMESHVHRPVQNPQPTPIPNDFLPSFVGANGAHIPNTSAEQFSVPDSPLPQAQEAEEDVQSLVASARRDDIPLDAELIPKDVEPPKQKYPKMRALKSQPTTTRLVVRKGRTGRITPRSVLSELVTPALGKASKLSRRIWPRGRRTGESLRLQAEYNLQSQAAESIQNLAKSKGGEVSDEEVNQMLSHIPSQPVIPTTFNELVSSKSKGSEDVESIPRIDE